MITPSIPFDDNIRWKLSKPSLFLDIWNCRKMLYEFFEGVKINNRKTNHYVLERLKCKHQVTLSIPDSLGRYKNAFYTTLRRNGSLAAGLS